MTTALQSQPLSDADTTSVGAGDTTEVVSDFGGGQILFGIEPNRLPPDLKRTGPYWELDHYEPMSGKVVGIWPWPHSGLPDFTTMRTKWGFSGILVETTDRYQDAINAGFNWKSMMVVVNPSNWQYVIDNYLSGRYYSGEPADHETWGLRPCVDCVSDWGHDPWNGEDKLALLPQIRAYANSRSAKYIIDGYKRCDHFIDAVNAVDFVMFSSYRHWFHPDGCSWECWYDEIEGDQRGDWTEMKNIFGSKFSSTWIGAHSPDNHGDGMDEIDDLCGHAANLGLSEIWLYCGSGVEPGKLEAFCDSAWRWGFLRRFEREYYIWWRCVDPGGCDPDYPDGWTIDYIEYTYNCREVFPSGSSGPGNCNYQ